MRKRYVWDDAKNEKLKRERGVSFEDVYYLVERDRALAVVSHPNRTKYPGQRMYVVELRGYAWLVPFFETEDEIVFKTIIPSRKATRLYLKEAQTDEKS